MVEKMKQTFSPEPSLCLLLILIFAARCGNNGPENKRITRIDSVENAAMAQQITSGVSTKLAEGMSLRIWADDSLVADPV